MADVKERIFCWTSSGIREKVVLEVSLLEVAIDVRFQL